MEKKLKASILVVPITLVIVIIVTVILLILKKDWTIYWLVGAFTGLLTHSLMVKENARIVRFSQLDPEQTTFNANKSAKLWYAIRFLAFAGIFMVLAFMAKINEDRMNIFKIVIAFGGYLISKITFIVLLLTIKEKKEVKAE